jgi:tetratricopeptide (TPR) repeat protein
VQLAYCVVYRNEGRYKAAFEHAQYAVILYEFAGRQAGQAIALDLMGCSCTDLGEPRHALACSRLALEFHRTTDNKPGEAGTWDSLGYASYLLGEYGEATACYRAALALFSAHALSLPEAGTRVRLGDVHLAAGDLAEVQAEWRHAQTILDKANHPGAAQLQPRLHFADAALQGRPGDRTQPAEVPAFEFFRLMA